MKLCKTRSSRGAGDYWSQSEFLKRKKEIIGRDACKNQYTFFFFFRNNVNSFDLHSEKFESHFVHEH